MIDLLKDKKSEFFIISTVIIVSILISIQGLFSGYSKVDFTKVMRSEEKYLFWNIKNQIIKTSKNSSDCLNLKKKLQEFKLLTEKEMKDRGYSFNIVLGNCVSNEMNVEINLISSDYNLYSNFTVP